MDNEFLVAIGTILLAIATFLLAFIAVFQDIIRAYLRSPELDCTIELSPPYCHMTIDNNKCHVFYCLFKISNEGKISAKNVEVIISEISRKVDNEFLKINDFIPDNLVWSLFTDRRIYCDYISPYTFKWCNLGHIPDPTCTPRIAGRDPSVLSNKNTQFYFDVHFLSYKLYYVVEPGIYKFTITIGCENARSLSKNYLMEITGKWFKDETRMCKEGFSIKEI